MTLKRLQICLITGFCWILSGMIGSAQDLGGLPDPQVLVSQPSANVVNHNLVTSLVDIKAVDAPALHEADNHIGIGSEVRYGQGIIIDADGIIATNRHIIGQAQHIYVMLASGQIVEAALLSNSKTDMCLIKINVAYPLDTVTLADPADIQIGNHVIAIANASTNSQRKLGGRIIKVYKELSTNKVELLEMNIPLHPGDSGGPVLNEDGSLLGLIMGKRISDPTKSYAIPASQIEQEYFKYRNSILN